MCTPIRYMLCQVNSFTGEVVGSKVLFSLFL
jgi:hypothetical protein